MGLNAWLADIKADVRRLTPRLDIDLEYENDSKLPIDIFTITGDVLLQMNGNYKGLATLSPYIERIGIPVHRRKGVTLHLDLNHHLINIVEETRKGRDVKLILDTRVLYTHKKEDGTKELCYQSVRVKSAGVPPIEYELEIPQSKWVNMLQNMGYARFRVIELPIPEPPKGTAIDKSLKHLREALKSFNEGDYDDVLGNCRKAIEEIERRLTKPKLEGILGSDSKAKKISHIQAKIKDFTNLGTHVGTKIDQRDAEMALHHTTSLIRYLARNLTKK